MKLKKTSPSSSLKIYDHIHYFWYIYSDSFRNLEARVPGLDGENNVSPYENLLIPQCTFKAIMLKFSESWDSLQCKSVSPFGKLRVKGLGTQG